MENEVEPIKLKNPQLIGKNHNKLSEIRSASNRKSLQRHIKDNRLDNRLDNRFDNRFDNPRKMARITHELRAKLRASYRQVRQLFSLQLTQTNLKTPKYYLNTTEANR